MKIEHGSKGQSNFLLKRSFTDAKTSSDVVTTSAVTKAEIKEAVFEILAMDDEEERHSTNHLKMVHDFAVLLEDHMQGIPEDKWHQFQIECLNLVHSYRQKNQQQ